MKPASNKDKGAATDAAAKAEPKKKAVAKRSPAPATASPKVALPKKPVKATAKTTTSAAETKTKSTAVKAPKSAKAKTGDVTLIIHVNAGMGNTVYVRGCGGGLRWDQGLAATNLGHSTWELKLSGVSEVVYCKILINDTIWSEGPDLPAMPGEATTFNPAFG